MNDIKKLKRRILRSLFPKYYLNKIFYKRMGYQLDLKNPKSFNEKIQWLKLYDLPKNSLVIECADKAKLPNYLNRKKLSLYAPPVLGSWNTFKDIPLEKLPNQFVLKGNNSSGCNLFVEDKTKINWEVEEKNISLWLKEDFGLRNIERHYSKMKPRIVAEAYLDLADDLLEYNFYCFNGIPRICRVIRFDDKIIKSQKATCYSPEWERLTFHDKESELANTVEHPENLQEMLDVCDIISKDFVFVRIDFLKCKDGVVLGELTFSPSAGYNATFTPEAQKIMGSWMDLSKSQFYKKRINS